MKLFLITDIHGSKKYLDMALDKFNKGQFNKLICLGDVLYHGPRNVLPEGYDTKAVYETLNNYKEKIIAIKGNCDADVDEFVLNFPLFPEVLMKIGSKQVLFIHGEDNPEDLEFDSYIIEGHYHVTKQENNIIKIGSLSLPKDGHHAYAIIDEDNLKVYDLLTDEVLLEVSL